MDKHVGTVTPTPTIKALLGLLGFFGSMMCLGMSLGLAQTLSVGEQSGNVGDTVSFTIRIDDALDQDVDAFGFHVTYDPEVLEYVDFVREELIDNFGYFDVNGFDKNGKEPGRIRVGGVSPVSKIERGSSGRVITLEFKVKSPGNTELAVVNLVDDAAGWSVQPGFFENIAAQASPEDLPEDVAPPSSTDQQEELSPEPPATLAENTEPQLPTIVTEEGNAQVAQNQTVGTSDPPPQSRTGGVAAQLAIPPSATKSTASQADKTTPILQQQASPRPPDPGAVSNTPASPQAVVSEEAAGVTPESRTSMQDTVVDATPTTAPDAQQQTMKGDSQAAQVTAKLVPQEAVVPRRESASERAPAGPSGSVQDDRRSAYGTDTMSETSFIPQTVRVVVLIIAVALLCVVGAVLVSLRKRE